MGFLKRIRGEASDQVPSWAGSMTSAEFGRFQVLVRDWLRANSRGFREVGGGGIEVDLGAPEPHLIGLTNLAQKCHQAPPDEWPTLIADHLNSVLGGDRPDAAPPLNSVKSMLKVRIYPEDYAAGLPADAGELLVKRRLAPGAIAALAIDYPDTVVGVTPKAAQDWAVPVDELFQLGLDNVRSQDRPGVQRQTLDGGGSISLLIGDSFFTATWVLMLGEFLVPRSPHGAVVAIPNRHVVVFQPIVDLSVIEGTRAVMALAKRMHRDGPGSISPNIYWWRAGELTLLPTRLSDDSAFFEPPAEFIDVLNQLHKPSAGS
jgi:hypothetical protein